VKVKITAKEIIELEQAFERHFLKRCRLEPQAVGGEPGEAEPQKRIKELEELLHKDHAHFRQISEEWDKFLRSAIPEHELIAERFDGGPKPIPPQLSDMYPLTKKQFEEWKESHLKQYRELEKLRCEVAKLKASEGKAGG